MSLRDLGLFLISHSRNWETSYRSGRGQKDEGQKNQIRHFFVSHISVIEMIAKAAGATQNRATLFSWSAAP